MSEATPYPSHFQVKNDDGTIITCTAAEFASALRARRSVPEEATVSVKESRQRIKFNQVERFISVRLDFRGLASMVARVRDEVQHDWAKRWALTIVEEDCLAIEDQMAFWMEAMFGKASVQTFMRSGDNPWVRGGNSALKGAQIAGLVTGGGES